MPFSVADRKIISKKMLDIPAENAQSGDNAAALQDAVDKLKAQDLATVTNFFDPFNNLIIGYHSEFALINGTQRTNITESLIVDSAKRVLGNAFFPNDVNSPISGPPSLPDGIWKEFKAYAGNYAVGKTQSGSVGFSVIKEQVLIDTISSAIVAVEAITEINRTTGLECNNVADASFCSDEDNPPQIDQISCEADNGTWNSVPETDLIIANAASISALATLDAAIAAWETFINGMIVTITVGDTNSGREALNVIAIFDANTTLDNIDSWQAFLDFDPGSFVIGANPVGTCIIFDGTNPNTLNPTRLRQAELDILKTNITTREAILVTREGELDSNLGIIVQSDSGSVTKSGLYGDRYTALDLRINLVGGFLSGQFGVELGQRSQNENIDSNNDALALYESSLKVSKFLSAGNETAIIHVEDNTEFNALDNVFIVTDNKPELVGQVVSKSGLNQITLNIVISNRYSDVDNSRIVKDLT